MFEAGRTNLFAFCSKIVCPLSSETIFTAKKPGSSAGCRTISSIRDRSSARVAGALVAGTTARELAETVGDCARTPIEVNGHSKASASRQITPTTTNQFLLLSFFIESFKRTQNFFGARRRCAQFTNHDPRSMIGQHGRFGH